MKLSLFAALAAGLAIPAFGLSRRYRRYLLDALDIDRIDVIGESAGATSALQLALRHPESVKHLAVLVGNLPGSPTEGYNFDLFVSNADVTNYNLEAIRVPTLIAHTKDDQLASHEASQRAAERIPGARFVSLESGGHFMLGQMKIVSGQLDEFLAERRDRRADRVAS